MKTWKNLDPIKKQIPLQKNEFVPEAAVAIFLAAAASIIRNDYVNKKQIDDYLERVTTTIDMTSEEVKKLIKEVIK